MRQAGKHAGLALAAAGLVGCSSAPGAAEPPPLMVPVEVTLPHPVSAADALTLRDSLDVVELRWSGTNAAGGVTASATLSDAEVLRNFAYGTAAAGHTPAVTAVSVLQPAAAIVSGVPQPPPVSAQLQGQVDAAAQGLPRAQS